MNKERLIHNIEVISDILDDVAIEKSLYDELKNTCKQMVQMLNDNRWISASERLPEVYKQN